MATKQKPKKKPANKRSSKLFTSIVHEASYSAGFDLHVYTTKDEMSKAIQKFIDVNYPLSEHEDHINCVGIFIETKDLEERAEKDVPYGNVLIFGTMFLCKQFLSVATIVHESVHAALANIRRCSRYEGTFMGGDDSGDNPEERLATIVESYTNNIISLCIKNKTPPTFLEDDVI